jgi:Na+-translocating ferredoxin:NAD+ oxidoreductase subunit A
VLTLSSIGTAYLCTIPVLVPLGLEFLRTIVFIVVIAAVVQFTEMYVRATSPLLHKVLGLYLPLITTNCAVLGVALLAIGLDTASCSRCSTASAPRRVLRW